LRKSWVLVGKAKDGDFAVALFEKRGPFRAGFEYFGGVENALSGKF
jgi:hypothetical protein